MRIALGEVEAGLKQHPAVAEVAVIVREDQSGNNQLVAFVSLKQGVAVEAREIQAFLATHLPGHMVPARLEILAEFPLNPNGKLDKRALAALLSPLKAGAEKHAAPQDELENRLLAIWRNLLEHPDSGMEDDFFALGGHSLLAVRLFAEIEKEFEVKLPLAILFQTPTPAGLARNIRDWSVRVAEGTHLKSSPLVPLQTRGSRPPFYCIHAVGGGALYYSAMASYMSEDQPFYGIQALESEYRSEHYASIETIARHYIEVIREVQPEGPYYLGGYSLGGSIAYEMARQLTALGQKIGLLVSFDHPSG
jgi:acyl carrier protein